MNGVQKAGERMKHKKNGALATGAVLKQKSLKYGMTECSLTKNRKFKKTYAFQRNICRN